MAHSTAWLRISIEPARITPLWLVSIVGFFFALAPLFVAQAMGPLRVDRNNPNYFIDASGRAILLGGAYLHHGLVESAENSNWTFSGYIDFLKQHNHNFTRLWSWEQAVWKSGNTAGIAYSSIPYERTGPGRARDGDLKYDLTRFNQDYFDELRSRVVEAQQQGVYVSVVLFEGFNAQTKGRVNTWENHPYHRDNNINRIDGDPEGQSTGEQLHSLSDRSIAALQRKYVCKLVDTLNDLENVLYEISGQGQLGTLDWQHHMIRYLKNYQATKPNQHVVGMSYISNNSDGDRSALVNSPADWILLEAFDTIITDELWPNRVLFWNQAFKMARQKGQWVWKSLTRGFNLLYPEADLNSSDTTKISRDAVSKALNYSQLLDLSQLSPRPRWCASTYCLVNPGVEYLIYLPSGKATANLSAYKGEFVAQWLDPATGQISSGGTVAGGRKQLFKTLPTDDALLHLRVASGSASEGATNPSNDSDSSNGRSSDLSDGSSKPSGSPTQAVATPSISPNGGTYSDSVSVTLYTSSSGASVYYTTDGTSPTEFSNKYTGPFTLTTATLVKAKALKGGSNPSAEASAWFTRNDISARLTLTWQDTSDDEEYFRLERRTSGTYTQIAMISANATSYTDTDVVRGVTYCYRVQAVNSFGASDYSNEACEVAS